MSLEERLAKRILGVVLGLSFTYMVVLLIYQFTRSLVEAANTGEAAEEAAVIRTELSKKIDEGKAFSASNRLTIAAGESRDILIENRSGKNIKIVVVEITTLSNINIDIYDNVHVDSHGNAWTIRNLNLASTYIPDVIIEDSGSYSGGELVGKKLGYGGAPARAIGSASEIGETVIIPDGSNIMIRLTNTESQSTTVSVVVLFYED